MTAQQLTKYGDVSAQPGEIAVRMRGGIVRIRLKRDRTKAIPTVLVRGTWEQTIVGEIAVPLVDGSVVKGLLEKFDSIMTLIGPDPMPLGLVDRDLIHDKIENLSDAQIEPAAEVAPSRSKMPRPKSDQ